MLGILAINAASFAAPDSAAFSPDLPRAGTAGLWANHFAYLATLILFETSWRSAVASNWWFSNPPALHNYGYGYNQNHSSTSASTVAAIDQTGFTSGSRADAGSSGRTMWR